MSDKPKHWMLLGLALVALLLAGCSGGIGGDADGDGGTISAGAGDDDDKDSPGAGLGVILAVLGAAAFMHRRRNT